MKKLLRAYVNENFAPIQEENSDNSALNAQKEKANNSDSSGFDGLYRRVQNRLKNDLWNHAAVMRRLNWDGDDNTNRSLFEKKLKRADNDAGGKYEFDKEELEKIITILDTEGKEG